jgi:hypothetical protein
VVNFEDMLGGRPVDGEPGDDEEDAEEEDIAGPTPASSSSQSGPSVGYRQLLAKARRTPGGEWGFKRALIEEAARHMDEIAQRGANDKERLKSRQEALQKLTRYVRGSLYFSWLKANIAC